MFFKELRKIRNDPSYSLDLSIYFGEFELKIKAQEECKKKEMQRPKHN